VIKYEIAPFLNHTIYTMFSKKEEKKLRSELGKKNVQLCKEAVKEMEELYADLTAAYKDIDTVAEEFLQFMADINPRINENDIAKMKGFAQKLSKVDKCARDAVRDVRDVLRNQKKRLKETQREA